MLRGDFFSLGGANLRSNFDHLNLFQSKKQHSVNIEQQLKLKLAWLVCKRLWHENKNVSYRSFYHFLGYNIQLLFSEGNKNLVGESLLGGNFSRWKWMSKLSTGRRKPPPIPSLENPELQQFFYIQNQVQDLRKNY